MCTIAGFEIRAWKPHTMNSLENIPYSTVSKEKKLSALETDNKQGVGR